MASKYVERVVKSVTKEFEVRARCPKCMSIRYVREGENLRRRVKYRRCLACGHEGEVVQLTPEEVREVLGATAGEGVEHVSRGTIEGACATRS